MSLQVAWFHCGLGAGIPAHQSAKINFAAGALESAGPVPSETGIRGREKTWLWWSKPMGSHFGIGAPLILVGIGMFTGGTGF